MVLTKTMAKMVGKKTKMGGKMKRLSTKRVGKMNKLTENRIMKNNKVGKMKTKIMIRLMMNKAGKIMRNSTQLLTMLDGKMRPILRILKTKRVSTQLLTMKVLDGKMRPILRILKTKKVSPQLMVKEMIGKTKKLTIKVPHGSKKFFSPL